MILFFHIINNNIYNNANNANNANNKIMQIIKNKIFIICIGKKIKSLKYHFYNYVF